MTVNPYSVALEAYAPLAETRQTSYI